MYKNTFEAANQQYSLSTHHFFFQLLFVVLSNCRRKGVEEIERQSREITMYMVVVACMGETLLRMATCR